MVGMVALKTAGFDGAGPLWPAAVANAPLPAEVHLLLTWRHQLLLARTPASGLWLLPSSPLDSDETIAAAACRTARDQLAVHIAPGDVHLTHAPFQPAGSDRKQGKLFAQAGRFRGVPLLVDRRRYDQLAWCPPARLPHPTAAHVIAAVAAWRQHRALSALPTRTIGASPWRTPPARDEEVHP